MAKELQAAYNEMLLAQDDENFDYGYRVGYVDAKAGSATQIG